MIPFVVSAGGGVSRKVREMITVIVNTEVARDEKTEGLRINGAFSNIAPLTKMEEAVR